MSPNKIHTRFLGSILAAFSIVAGTACSPENVIDTRGEPCGGGGQFAIARVALPDTGIDANTSVEVDLNQHDTLEVTDVIVRHLLPAGVLVDSAPDPRVRLLNSVADVLLDTLAGRENHATWFVTKTIKDSPDRNAFYDAFQKDSLFLELRPPDGIGPGTRVKLKTQQVGVEPYLICV